MRRRHAAQPGGAAVGLAVASALSWACRGQRSFPWLVRAVGVEQDEEPAREELLARKVAARSALDRIEQLRAEPWTRDDSADRLRAIYDFRYRRLAQRAGKLEDEHDDLDARSVAW